MEIESLFLKRIVFQKNNKNYYINLNKKIQEKMVFRTSYGILNFLFREHCLFIYFEDYLNFDDIPIDFFTLEIQIPDIEQFRTYLHQGYNNWTQTYEVPIKNKQLNVSGALRWLLAPFGEYTIIRHIKNFSKHFLRSHFYTYLRDDKEQILMFCSLNEKEAFTIFQLDYKNSLLRIIKDFQSFIPRSKFPLIALYIRYGEYYQVFQEISNQLDGIMENPVSGYTSWYYHYNKIHYDELIKRIEFYGRNQIPIDYFQIDDGYQKRVGDWLHLKRDFENRMKELVQRIRHYHIKAGIWIAPFICEKKSYLYQYHSEWLLKDSKGKPVPAGFNPLWSGKFYALNIYHPDFREYIKNILRTFTREWGFELLKLDFLYAGCLYPIKKKTRAQQMQDALELIHESIDWKRSSVKLLGCGIPFSHAFGNVNFTRVGSDVEEKWENFLKNFNFLERISTFSSLNSTVYRHPFNGKNFLNDPDVFYLREKFRSLQKKDLLKKIFLSEEEKLTLLYVNQILGGFVLTSDPIEHYNPDTLQLYKKTFPFLKKEYQYFSLVNEHAFEIRFHVRKHRFYRDPFKKNKKNLEEDWCFEYVFFTNLSEEVVTFSLDPNQIYFVAFPFQKKYGMLIKEKKEISLNPHHSLLLLKVFVKPFQLLGSNGHIFPLSEISKYHRKKQSFYVEIEPVGIESLVVYIAIPEKDQDKLQKKYSIRNYDGIPFIELEVVRL